MAARWFVRIVLPIALVLGLLVGVLSWRLAVLADTASWAGGDAPADVVLLVVGWGLLVAGAGIVMRATERAPGLLLIAAGFAWFVTDWNNQFSTSWVVFSVGLLGAAVCPVLVGHAVLRYEGRRLDRLGRVSVVAGYLVMLVLAGLLPALFFDPTAQGCARCPANVLALQSLPDVVAALGRVWIGLAPVSVGLLMVAIGRQLGLMPPGRRRVDAPVLLAGIGYLLAVGVGYLVVLGSSFVPINGTTRLLWTIQGLALLILAIGTRWPVVRRARIRARVARLVVDIAGAPPIGGLTSMLSRSLADPSFRVLYRFGDGSLVDAAGDQAVPVAGQMLTPVVRSGHTVAVLTHRPGLLDDPALAAEITAASRLALDNERLQAQSRAELADLRQSRARIVSTGDAERRRLERDLHDGAQQLLVSLSLALALAAIRRAGRPPAGAGLQAARAEVVLALGELRALARGIYPRELADEGLAAAFETLAESSAVPVTIDRAPHRRFPHAVEAAAYHLVSRLIKDNNDGPVRLRATGEPDQDRLLIEVAVSRAPADLAGLQDRVGAVGGEVIVDEVESGVRVRAVLPCGS